MTLAASELFFYGSGVPRYIALWLIGMPLLVLMGQAVGMRGRRSWLLVATTLPTLLTHFAALPFRVPFPVRWALTIATFAVLAALLVARREPLARRGGSLRPVAIPVTIALVVLAVVVRAVLAWLDPGISDIPQASETAARQVLAGENPYTEPNDYTVAGVYQYPAATILWHLPFVAAIPDRPVAGEDWLAARAAAWAIDAVAVLVLCLLGSRVAGALYALHPTLVRETGLTAANDVLMGLCLAAAAWFVAEKRPVAAGVAMGFAVSVKPPAVVVVPILLLMVGWRPVLLAGGIAAALQAPFLLWPQPGLHGVAAILEPAARASDGYDILHFSAWWPAYAAVGTPQWFVSTAAVTAAVAAVALAWWAARRLPPDPDWEAVLAAMALPMLALFALAPFWRTTYQNWMLPLALLAAAAPLVPTRGRGPRSPKSTTLDVAG